MNHAGVEIQIWDAYNSRWPIWHCHPAKERTPIPKQEFIAQAAVRKCIYDTSEPIKAVGLGEVHRAKDSL